MNELLQYVEGLTLTQGPRAGQRFELLGWERRFLRGAFAAGVGEAALTVGRGGGKSTLTAAIGAAAVDGPLAMPRAEAIVAASSFAQARIVFGHALAFLGGEDRRRYRIADSPQAARIEDRETGSALRCIGSDPRRAHGLAPVLVIADEGAQWSPGLGERLIAALRTSMGKIDGGRLLAIGTRPESASHWFARMLDGGADYCQIHAARPGDPPFQRRTWERANPSLRHMPELLEATRREAERARRDESLLASFLALRLNLGTSDTPTNLLLEAGTWASIEGTAEASGPCCWGVDLGGSAAQSAIAAYWPDTGLLRCLAAFPAEPDLRQRGIRDAVDSLYLDCARRGELIVLGSRTVPVGQLIAEARERFGRPVMVAADRWREAELRDALDEARLRVPFMARGQGYRDGGEDVREFRRGCLDGSVTPEPSLLLRAAMAEARVLTDPAGNSKLAKATEGGRRRNARDDAAAAAIIAVSLGRRHPPPKPVTYRSRIVR
ncbi:MAG: terminase large subunit [Acidimicrobiaceae bacterium]|nr:terminase large subunit [Acidimicrobiaceae bacterium]